MRKYEHVCSLLTEYKNAALQDLNSISEYKARREYVNEIKKKLVGLLDERAKEALEEYIEGWGAVTGMEINYCYLRGFLDFVSIERLTKEEPEQKALLKEFMGI